MRRKKVTNVDYIDAQSFAADAEGTARRLLQEHGGLLDIQSESPEFKEEVGWAQAWLKTLKAPEV